ncbi:hypothetical protein ACFFMM_21835 [Micromonospora chaiyaphumensis]|uniref:Uncharacterized protein n=1 Tax=Micromonospora chaiyaphumensis TaxID=307119 RepID=A0A1C4U1V3_9ACTN|nr:hypothetical protein [Micromonospora chaiyaphumensis]SCE65672.1 hypothetical protein GA0070214_101269 [Micromonospora chaiyaphumensis]
MKQHFTRWLPAIAKTAVAKATTVKTAVATSAIAQSAVAKTATVKTSIATSPNRRTALTVAGVACLGGLAFGPTAVAAPVTSGPHAGALAAIDLATGKRTGTETVKSDLTTGSDKVPTKTDQPSREELMPRGVEGAQSRIPLDNAQLDNAKAIVKAAKETGVGERGAVIGVATSLQESKLYNLGHLGDYNDHDSEGLFQQRPSSGWGTPDQITDPDYASKAFFNALKNVGGWQDLPLTAAAQTVQVSAFPYAYAQWEEQAADIVQQLW